MINSREKAIVKKDINGVLKSKSMFSNFLLIPVIMAAVLPTIFLLIAHFTPDLSDFESILDMLPGFYMSENVTYTILNLLLNYVMPIFFILIPIISTSIVAASSFVGEKERRTLETLLYSPLSINSIFQAKVIASFILGMSGTYVGFVLLIIVVQVGASIILGGFLSFSLIWLIVLVVVSPAVTLLTITLVVRVSAKAKTIEEANTSVAFLILPVMLMMVAQFTGLFFISEWMLLGLGVLLAVIGILLMRYAMRSLTYERLLR
jgi:ABC-type Na+ efflux pump permease subunit